MENGGGEDDDHIIISVVPEEEEEVEKKKKKKTKNEHESDNEKDDKMMVDNEEDDDDEKDEKKEEIVNISDDDDLNEHDEKESLMQNDKKTKTKSKNRKRRTKGNDKEEEEEEVNDYGTGKGKRIRAPRNREERGLMLMIWVMIAMGYVSVITVDFGVGGYYKSLTAWIIIVLYTLIVILLIATFVMVITTDTYVRRDWVPQGVSQEVLDEVKAKSVELDAKYKEDKVAHALSHYENLRYCNLCKAYQPIRSHHCKECKRCTLRLDHHCPWVGSCIGYYNQKIFFLFLLYGIIAIVITCVWHIIEIARIFSSKSEENVVIIQLGVLIFVGSFCLALFPLLLTQWSTFMTNLTTYESIISVKIKRANSDFVNPFDVGVLENMKQFLGDSAWTWFIPIRPKRLYDAGTSFPTRTESNENLV